METRSDIQIISYNLHGYNQGFHVVRDLACRDDISIFLLQEHWLTPSNLVKFEENFPKYDCFGCSAMNKSVEKGVLRGRPYGGLMTLINKKLSKYAKLLCACERYIVIAIDNLLLVNVYFPCNGTPQRDLICEEILDNLQYWKSKYPNYNCIIGGDFNTCLSSPVCSVSKQINKFMTDSGLFRCDSLGGATNKPTFRNEAQNSSSFIDYFFCSDLNIISDFDVLEPDVNFSDHSPIILACRSDLFHINDVHNNAQSVDDNGASQVSYLRWDHADVLSYFNLTGHYLQSVYDELDLLDACNNPCETIESIYQHISDILLMCSTACIPSCKKSFFKYWWEQEFDILKETAAESCRAWKSAGRPRGGPIFNKYRSDKNAYRKAIREGERKEKNSYSNDLHEALAGKDGPSFWKSWRAKFESNRHSFTHINGVTDPVIITDMFARHFSVACSHTTKTGAENLKQQYEGMRPTYCGSPHSEKYEMDAELIEQVISKLKRGKAAGLDSLTAEHLQYCHSLLPCILAKLFNSMLHFNYVPISFGQSYTVPLYKNHGNVYSKSPTVEDFRGISISSILSKVFEHCIFTRYEGFLVTSENQFGFKKKSGCTHAIYTLRRTVEYYTSAGSTVNICSLDLSKAFDKMNHHGLFITLMKRRVPVNLLVLFEHWFNTCFTCVKWSSCYSAFFKLCCGVRQGGVLSPYFFAIYIDSLVHRVKSLTIGCVIHSVNFSILLYADDILLLAPTVTALKQLLIVCEVELKSLDMCINVNKSACIRVGPRYKSNCSNITTSDGQSLSWATSVRYLGIVIINAVSFSCSFKHSKAAFYRAFNAIFGKVGRIASENVTIELLSKKCLPILLYAIEVCPLSKSNINELQFAVTGAVMKIFDTKSKDIANTCAAFFGLRNISTLINTRQNKFLFDLNAKESIMFKTLCSL